MVQPHLLWPVSPGLTDKWYSRKVFDYYATDHIIREIDTGVDNYLIQHEYEWPPNTSRLVEWYDWRQEAALCEHACLIYHRVPEPDRLKDYCFIGRAGLSIVEKMFKVKIVVDCDFEVTTFLVWVQARTYAGSLHAATPGASEAYNFLVEYGKVAKGEHARSRTGPYIDAFFAQYNTPGYKTLDQRLAEYMERGQLELHRSCRELGGYVLDKDTGGTMSPEEFWGRAREDLRQELLEEARKNNELREQHYQDFLHTQTKRLLETSLE
ncbi:hypothetical protein BDZ45DRAFT_784889 [Acephala macrosclerotiorum]|nr:hypothetical protein BDZ45DRAFT_784889 [Acephala macrosclerotiorum]